MSMSGKVVAVSGTSSGIGRTVAEVFAERGASVVGCARREDKGRKVEKHIREQGGEFTFVTADITNQADCNRFVDTAVQEYGKLDVLINNAGAGAPYLGIDEISAEDFDAVVRQNLYGALYCSQRAIQKMRSGGQGGVILSIASVQGVLAVAKGAAYNAAKAGLIQFSNSLAVEFLDEGIRSNVIVMGGAPTAAAAYSVREISLIRTGHEPDFSQNLPTPLTGTPLRDIATALVALASDDARAITGATIAIDQGQSAGSLYSEAIFHALSGGWSR